MSLLNFIKSLRPLLKQKQSPHVFVLGNSSADYDSIFGSILYAFFMTHSLKVLHLPLIDCSQADMSLRFEVAKVMNKVGFSASDLLYTEMFTDLYQSNHTFLLYDHNQRSQIPQNCVIEIIDHHAVNCEIMCPHLICHCGSALTLLFYLYHPNILKQAEKSEVADDLFHFLSKTGKKELEKNEQDPKISELMMYGILLDTYNFDENQKQRWTEIDKIAYNTISKQMGSSSSQHQSQAQSFTFTFEDLSSAKSDENLNLNLTLDQHIRKDYKQIQYAKAANQFLIHYSVVFVNVHKFIHKYINDINQKYTKDSMKQGEIYSFMFAFIDSNDPEKKLQKFKLFNSKEEKLILILEEALSNEGNFKKLEDVGEWKLWTDPTGLISRKKIDAYLKQYFNGSSM